MGKRIFVGNLAYSTTDQSLREHFEAKGHKITKASVVLDRETGRSRGFAFVDLGDDEDLDAVVAAFHDREIDGRRATVTEAIERSRSGPPRGPRPSYGDGPRGGGGPPGGGGGGGYRDNGPPQRSYRDNGPPPAAPSFVPPPPPPDEDPDPPSRKRREKPAPKRRTEERAPRRSNREEERRPKNKWRGGRGWEADDDD